MLVHHRRPISLSLLALDLPVAVAVDTSATLYQRERDRFHILLAEPVVRGMDFSPGAPLPWDDLAAPPRPAGSPPIPPASPHDAPEDRRFLWLEVSPYRAIGTMQGNGRLSYRHLWERGVYGLSRYWLHSDDLGGHAQMRLRNFTRNLTLTGDPLPEYFRLEYELWAGKVQMGRYVLSLEIHH